MTQRVVERAGTRPHAGEPRGEGEEMQPGEENARDHAGAQCRNRARALEGRVYRSPAIRFLISGSQFGTITSS